MSVYFMQPLEGGPVKIGCAVDVERRKSGLESLYGRRLRVLATIPGGRDEEARIHARFAHLRFRNKEQFRPALDLMTFIGQPSLTDPEADGVQPMQRAYKGLRITDEALRWARIASAFTGETVVEYMSRILTEQAREDIDRLHAEFSEGT